METAARLMRNLVAPGRLVKLESILVDSLPWVRFLPERDRSDFAQEFAWTLEACTDLDVWAPFGRMLHDWQQTAAIHAEPGLAKELSRALDADLGPVMMPSRGDDSAEEA